MSVVGLIKKALYKYDYTKYGMILQLPAPKQLVDVFNDIVPMHFDVDGFGDMNFKNIMSSGSATNPPATPKGIMTLLHHYNIPIEGKHVVIVGRSNIVGKPMSQLLINKGATVTVCNSKTKDLKSHLLNADIVISAVGQAKMITKDMIKQGAIVIDVGITRLDDGKICGDVDFENVSEVASYITPVPGGVGPMTIAMLMNNVILACKNRR